MPLLEIKPTRKLTVLCAPEESMALQVDQYAGFANASGDEVVNKAPECALRSRNIARPTHRRRSRCPSTSPHRRRPGSGLDPSPRQWLAMDPARRSAVLCASCSAVGSEKGSFYAVTDGVVFLTHMWRETKDVLHTWKRLTLHSSEGGVRASSVDLRQRS